MTGTFTSFFQNFINVLPKSQRPRRSRYDQAFRTYRDFKNLDARAMKDIGVTEGDVERARFKEFLDQPHKH